MRRVLLLEPPVGDLTSEPPGTPGGTDLLAAGLPAEQPPEGAGGSADGGARDFRGEVERASDEPGSLAVRIAGVEGAASVFPVPGGFAVRRGRRTVEAGVTRTRSGGLEVRLGGHRFRIIGGRARRAVRPGRSRSRAGGAAAVRTSMPGKVVRILRTEGETVEAGQGVLVFEAMKMQNEIAAPAAGVIAKLRVEPGTLLEGGAFLFAVEPVAVSDPLTTP